MAKEYINGITSDSIAAELQKAPSDGLFRLKERIDEPSIPKIESLVSEGYLNRDVASRLVSEHRQEVVEIYSKLWPQPQEQRWFSEQEEAAMILSHFEPRWVRKMPHDSRSRIRDRADAAVLRVVEAIQNGDIDQMYLDYSGSRVSEILDRINERYRNIEEDTVPAVEPLEVIPSQAEEKPEKKVGKPEHVLDLPKNAIIKGKILKRVNLALDKFGHTNESKSYATGAIATILGMADGDVKKAMEKGYVVEGVITKTDKGANYHEATMVEAILGYVISKLNYNVCALSVGNFREEVTPLIVAEIERRRKK